MEQVQQYFDNHPSHDQLFFTSDGLAFFVEADATKHAQHLDDTTVTMKTRDEADAELLQLNEYRENDDDWLDELLAA